MSEDVTITFTADIAELQRGLREATSGITEAAATMRAGATQVGTSFADLTRAYAAGVQQRLDLVKAGSDQELAIARAGDRAETDILLDGIKLKQAQVKEEAQISQLSHDDEQAALLALEADREAIERRHLTFLQATYQDNATAYAGVQRQIDELAAQSALKRQQIEATYARQVYADYRGAFEQVGSSLSQQVSGLISGQQTLRQAVASVTLSIIQDFVAARLKIVADWAAGVVAQTAATNAGEAAKTSAVLAGTAARTTAEQTANAASAATTIVTIGKSIIASAAETFAGIFGFLAPVLGPAAAGPAGAGQATVLAVGAGLPSFDTGAWSLPADMIAQVHRGEMIVPAGPAAQMRAAASGGSGTVHVHHKTHLNVSAMDSRDVKRFFSGRSRAILAAINDGVRSGSHLGLSKLGALIATDPMGVNLLPACNEWVYDTLPHRAARLGESTARLQNRYAGTADGRTDYALSIDQLQATYPGCRNVSLVCAWFGNASDVTRCAIYPSTTFIGGTSEMLSGGVWQREDWQCSGLTQASPGLIPISSTGAGTFVYGGTPSDPSIVRCIRDLKSRGFRVTFYPFILMDYAGYPWRGRISFGGADMSQAATDAVNAWLGSATPTQFTPDAANLTVGYAGSPTDWTFRRMILHYANLCVIAGGVDLFLIGSELRGLEAIRGLGWSKAGTQANGVASWDYPFVTGLTHLAADVRGIFDRAGLTKDKAGLKKLIAYSADWSSWMGVQHADSAGQWPHLDPLYASDAIDLVSFDNYLPLSDWTTGGGGLDFSNWSVPTPASWPPDAATMCGLGLPQPPFLASKAYLKTNIEGGERYNWFYYDGENLGRGWDPNGSALNVSRPVGDRLAQARHPYQAGQEILAQKKLRWWWSNPHRAVYDAGDGQGWVPQGPPTAWVPQSKSIIFAEYGFPTCDRCTNQPNVFYDPKSSESFTPYWSAWERADGGSFRPVRDDTLASLARDALVEYWTVDGHNITSGAGVKMIEPTFMAAWNWDARPFPVFPQSSFWGDTPNWRAGTWIGGKGPSEPPGAPDAALADVAGAMFPTLAGLGWSVDYKPAFTTQAAKHVSGRESRGARNAAPLWEIQMSFDVLSNQVSADVATLAGFYAAQAGQARPFQVGVPAELGLGATIPCRFADDTLDVETFAQRLAEIRRLTLCQVRL